MLDNRYADMDSSTTW